jgi:hypothetical protein
VQEDEPDGDGGRWGVRRAANVAIATSPATVLAAVAIGWMYSQFTEFDRPRPLTSLPFLIAQAVWCTGVVLLAFRGEVTTALRPLAVRLSVVGGFLAALVAAAPSTPIPQGAVLLGGAFVLPPVVVTALAWPGPLVAALRAVVAGIGLAVGLPAALLVLLVASTRSMSIPLAASIAAFVAHVPITLLTTVIRGERTSVPVAVPPRPAIAVAVAPLALACAGLIALGGLASRPLSPAEQDPLLAEVAAVHRDLNSAVGWDAWRPRALSPTGDRLARAIALSEGAPEMVDAAAYVRDAIDDDDRAAAVVAHRIVAGFERNVRQARELIADSAG